VTQISARVLPPDSGALRPYVGAGAAYAIIVKNHDGAVSQLDSEIIARSSECPESCLVPGSPYTEVTTGQGALPRPA